MPGNTCSDADALQCASSETYCGGGVSLLHGNRQVFKHARLQPEFHARYQRVRTYKPSEDFQIAVVEPLRKTFSDEFSSTPCGKMSDAIFRHISCSTNTLLADRN